MFPLVKKQTQIPYQMRLKFTIDWIIAWGSGDWMIAGESGDGMLSGTSGAPRLCPVLDTCSRNYTNVGASHKNDHMQA